MKRAVVLSGGGTKGAYELGVWRALIELSVDFQIVTGTSIGSINGAMMAAGDFEKCESMWHEMTMGDLMSETHTAARTLKQFFTGDIYATDVFGTTIVSGGVDNSPFYDFIEKNVDEESIRKSDCDYGLVTVRIRDRKPFCLPKSEIPKGLLNDYVIASSSVYPIFPMHLIGEDYYIDGMYHDNLPIDLAASMGAGEFVVVDLHPEPQHPHYAGRPYVTYITPSEDLGGILEFDRKRLEKNIEMGYRDAMRAFGRYKGYSYCFYPSGIDGFGPSIETFNEYCARGEAAINMNTKSRIKRAGETRRMFSLFEKYARGRTVGREGYFLRGAEIAAEICGLSREKVWDLGEMVDEIVRAVGSRDAYPDADFFVRSDTHLRRATLELKKNHDSKYLMGCLYHAAWPADIDYAHMLEIRSIMPSELAGSLFLLSVDEKRPGAAL